MLIPLRVTLAAIAVVVVAGLCTACGTEVHDDHGQGVELRSGVYSGREGTTIELSEAEEIRVLGPLTELLAAENCVPIAEHEVGLGGIYLSHLPIALSGATSNVYVVNGKVVLQDEGSGPCAIPESVGELISVLRSIAQNHFPEDEFAILTLDG